MLALSIAWLFEINSTLKMWQVELAAIVFVLRCLITWSWWKGRNWARILVALYSGLALIRLLQWRHVTSLTRQLWMAEAALAIFLLLYLPREEVSAFFTRKPAKAPEAGAPTPEPDVVESV